MDVTEDKRQVTGNLVHAADGTLILYQQVFEGAYKKNSPSDSASLPSLAARGKVNGGRNEWLFGVSHNHWSNEQEKMKLIKRLVEYRAQRGSTTAS